MGNDFTETEAVVEIVNRYAGTWRLLLQYDEDRLPPPGKKPSGGTGFEVAEARQAIAVLKRELLAKGEATAIFGQERGEGLAGIIGALYQTLTITGQLRGQYIKLFRFSTGFRPWFTGAQWAR